MEQTNIDHILTGYDHNIDIVHSNTYDLNYYLVRIDYAIYHLRYGNT